MSTSPLLTQLLPLFRETLDQDDLVLQPETRPRDVSGWDSLAHVRLVAAIEEALGIQFSLDDVKMPETVGAFLALIEARRS